MFAWWWLVIMFFIGCGVGIVLTALCASNRADLKNARKWWDEE